MTRRSPVAGRLLLLALVLPSVAGATNGYFGHGYGVKSQGLAGVGFALPLDSLAAASNPAGTALVGDRFDVGLTWFVPERSASIVGNAFGPDATFDGDGKKNFFLPEIGFTRQFSKEWGAGIALYGNGGLNTEYKTNPFGRFGATGTAGVNLEQLFIVPSVAYRITPEQTVGAAINIAYQRFSAQGIGLFGGFSSAPNNVSNQGTDTSLGAGIRLGWSGTFAPGFTVGASWASKVKAGKFDKYKGLFSDGGSFDIPSTFGAGVAWTALKELTVGLDVQRILYSGVESVGNPLSKLFQGRPLGSSNGPGFGWRDTTVYKIGVNYDVSPGLVVRAGFSTARQPIPESETFFNILAPGVVEQHYTIGATWAIGGGELSGFYALAPKKTIKGANSIPPGPPPGGFGGGNANISLKENILGFAFGWKL